MFVWVFSWQFYDSRTALYCCFVCFSNERINQSFHQSINRSKTMYQAERVITEENACITLHSLC